MGGFVHCTASGLQTVAMRISGGTARGTRLRVPKGARPASERVRLAVFSSLAETVDGAHVLDLYCGSGAYGLEALSRGAASVVAVDEAAASCRAAAANAAAAGFSDRVTVRRADARRYAARDAAAHAPFGLVFADPPYDEAAVVPALLTDLVRAVAAGATVVVEIGARGLAPGAFAAVERLPDENSSATPAGWVLEGDRGYGDTRILTFRRDPSEDQ